MSWTKEHHGAKDFGHRRSDNLAYVGRRASGWWASYVRFAVDEGFKLLDCYSTDQAAMADADGFLEGKVAA